MNTADGEHKIHENNVVCTANHFAAFKQRYLKSQSRQLFSFADMQTDVCFSSAILG